MGYDTAQFLQQDNRAFMVGLRCTVQRNLHEPPRKPAKTVDM